jgi:transposase
VLPVNENVTPAEEDTPVALGKRGAAQQEFWISAVDLPKAPGHPFYTKLNEILAEAEFDAWVESRCAEFYAKDKGRPSIPPGVYFRMLFVVYFEGLGSQRGIAWRCSDSLSVRSFLGISLGESSPEHSSLTRVRKRLPLEVHEEVFKFVLGIAIEKKLVKGKTVAVDATTLEANAAMKSIERKDTGEDYKEYVRKLAEAEGIKDPSDEELRRFDKKRKGKKLSNKDWQSSTDRDSRIMKMKDGRTHLAYKAENSVDLDTDIVLSADIYHADQGDADTATTSVVQAQKNLVGAGSDASIEELVADKGYHKAQTLSDARAMDLRTYIPEPESRHRRRWTDKPAEYKQAVYANRRRVRGNRSKRLQRRRSEYVERTFAHMCETGGGRRTWLRGLEQVTKRYLLQAAARNLGVILRELFGVGTARALQGSVSFDFGAIRRLWAPIWRLRLHRAARSSFYSATTGEFLLRVSVT